MKINAIDENGKLKEYDVILTYHSDNYNKEKSLKGQKQLLIEKQKRLEKIIETLDKTIKSMNGGEKMTKKDMFKGFDNSYLEKHKAEYAKEAKKLYGESDAYKESQRKTSKYSSEDWNNVMDEANEIYKELAKEMDKTPDDMAVQELVEKWRNYISNNFYDCKIEIFRGLADLYIADERFKNNIDKFGEGLAEFLSKAIKIYCENNK